MATKTIIYRPTEDSKHNDYAASSGSNVYAMVNEAVADDDSTYASGSSSDSFFVIAYYTPPANATYVSSRLVARAKVESGDATMLLELQGSTSTTTSGATYISLKDLKSALSTTYTDYSLDCVNPAGYPHLRFSISHTSSGKGTIRVTQIYYEVTYEVPDSTLIKQNGAWAELAGTIYQKQNGVWVEVDASALADGDEYMIVNA